MGISYRHTSRISVEVWRGNVTVLEAQRHLADLVADGEWGVQGAILTDLRGMAPEARPSAEDLQSIAAMFIAGIGNRVHEAKWAVVADITFDDATTFSSYIESTAPRLIVFNELATACAWLGVAEDEVRDLIDQLRDSESA